MAKTKAPLFGLGASGQLGKAIVFGSWKGIGTAREYVKPSNPDTVPQQTQRARVTAAVTAFHAAAFSVADMTAWARLASIQSSVMSGFNVFCKIFMDESKLGNTWTAMSACVISEIDALGWLTTITKVSGGLAPYLWVGSRPTFLSNTQIFVDATGNSWTCHYVGAAADTDYYMQVKVGVSGATFGCVGIYKVRTAAA
jgi:hypothetical protein